MYNSIKPSWFIVIGILLVGVWVVGTYNSLIGAEQGVRTEWSQVETQYQRRMDLIPNVVKVVEKSARFEMGTLEAIVKARSMWSSAVEAKDLNAEVKAANAFDASLARILVTVEAYPTLKSTEAFRDLMAELEGTENRVSVARRDYNNAVGAFNVRVRRFPTNLVAKLFGFETASMFESVKGAENAPDINLDVEPSL